MIDDAARSMLPEWQPKWRMGDGGNGETGRAEMQKGRVEYSKFRERYFIVLM